MDISKKYIKMCEEARKILKEHKWESGDFRANAKLNIVGVWTGKYHPPPPAIIWLPRQDQLQEMVFPSKDLGFELKIAELFTWISTENNERRIYRILRSWEQLWLAFVMKEKYSKTWDDKNGKWIKQ